MHLKDFKSPLGSLVPIRGTDSLQRNYDHVAFLPAPLPSSVDLSGRTWTSVACAAEALGRLNQACSSLPNPRLLVMPALYREAQTTSELEGTHATTEEIMLQGSLPFADTRSPEADEVLAYVHIAENAFEWIRDRRVTKGLLCSSQDTLAKHSIKKPLDPGKVREHQVIIGPEGCRVEDARFVPQPPGDQLNADFRRWLDWVENAPKDIHSIAAAAIAHYQFETMHPFGDGNGRLGRLSILLQLLRSGSLDEPSFSISSWLVKRRTEYQDLLLGVSQLGDWNAWVTFFANAVETQARSAADVAKGLNEWKLNLLHQLNSRNYSGTIVNLANDLIDWPYISTAGVSEKYKVTVPAAQSAIDRLADLGFITERTGGTYARRWGADYVMMAVESL